MKIPDDTSVLSTESVLHISTGVAHTCKQRLENTTGDGGILSILAPMERFAVELISYFDKHGEGTSLAERVDSRNQIEFTLSYRALEERLFTQRYAFVVRFSKQRAWIEPLGSLLENSTKQK